MGTEELSGPLLEVGDTNGLVFVFAGGVTTETGVVVVLIAGAV